MKTPLIKLLTLLFLIFFFTISFANCNSNFICETNETYSSCPSDCFPSTPTNENVLCVYNANNEISTQICEYYLEKHSGAFSIGIDFSDSNFTDAQKETSLANDFEEFIVTPVLEWVNSSGENITHLAIAKGLPIRVNDPSMKSYPYGGNVYSADSYLISPFSKDSHYLNDFRIEFENDHVHFDPNKYKDSGQYTLRFAVSYLTGYTLEDIKKMIDKAQQPISNLSTLAWVLDKDVDGFPIKKLNYYTSALVDIGINEENIIRNYDNSSPISTNKKVIGYYGPGKHHTGYENLWITKTGLFNFYVSNRAIMSSLESYNATTFTGNNTHPSEMRNSTHGKLADAISPQTFEGSNYSNSFSGAGGHTEEPYHPGELDPLRFFPAYASGLTLGEAYLASHGPRWRHIMVGDPLMRINDSAQNKKLVLASCENDLQCASNNCTQPLRSENNYCNSNNENCLFSYGNSSIHALRNKNYYCDGEEIYQCSDGGWVQIEKLNNQKCKIDYANLETSIAFFDYNAHLVFGEGAECEQSTDCFANVCSEDIGGVKRCHTNQDGCIKGEGDSETDNGSFTCLNENEKVLCSNGEWKLDEKVLCQNGCLNGKCEGEIFKNNVFKFLANKEYTITIPSNIGIKKISELFINPPLGIKIYTYSEGWNTNSFSISRPCPNGCWIDPDMNIYPGEGIFIELTSNENYDLEITNTKFSKSIQIQIKGRANLIGIPFNKKYTASKIIKELNEIDSTCSKITMGGDGQGTPTFWEKESDADFFIHSYLGYWVTCGENSNFTWTPKKGFCEDNEKWINEECIRTDIHRIINKKEFDLIIDNQTNPDKNFFDTRRIRLNSIKHAIEFDHNFSKEDLNLDKINIDFNQENKSIIVKGVEKTKDITLERTENERVCVADLDLNSTEELIQNCVEINCPGTRNNLSCEINEDTITIKGLNHSGIILLDPLPSYCGDEICNIDENCYNCENDCGKCECFENSDCILHDKVEKTCDGNNLVTKIYYPECIFPINSDPYCEYNYSKVTSPCQICVNEECQTLQEYNYTPTTPQTPTSNKDNDKNEETPTDNENSMPNKNIPSKLDAESEIDYTTYFTIVIILIIIITTLLIFGRTKT
jgi:hypothetical protein